LKSNVLSIFQITNIRTDFFLDADAQAASKQLKALCDKNWFLYATE